MVVISIPVSLLSISAILNHEVDETLLMQSEQFLKHVKHFEYLDDLDRDLVVLDQLTYNVHIKPAPGAIPEQTFENIQLYDSLEREERPYRQLSSVVSIQGKPYRLIILISLVDNNDLLLDIGLVQTMLMIVLTAGLLLINRSLSKKIWKPFYKMLDQLKAYAIDKSETIPTRKSQISEFDDLNETIGILTERNRKIFLQQKEFIEDASHELQTPLAIFQSQLDTLMQQPGLSEAVANGIGNLEDTAQRMSRLNKNLLLLSKIENQQFSQTESLDIHSLVSDYVNKLSPLAVQRGLSFHQSLTPCHIQGNRTLLEILITNILHNAILHTDPDGIISVTLTQDAFEVSNTGTPLDFPARIFERFRKENNRAQGSGLGLAIVKKICDSVGYRVTYAYLEGKHTFYIGFTN